MHTINFSLDFFAERICTEPEKLSYCVIQRTYNNPEYGCCRFPGLCVEGLGEYAYSLTEGYFVRLGEIFGDSIITVESAMIEAVEDGYIFRTASGIEDFFSINDLTKVWYTRILNDRLK
ncbi:MAG: hypothetical protein IKT28_05855 [Rikenellaceae bacterium]|jgi:hypothetical protein|nr:hypothetical protein [Rikenellaceae bacterium]